MGMLHVGFVALPGDLTPLPGIDLREERITLNLRMNAGEVDPISERECLLVHLLTTDDEDLVGAVSGKR